MRFNGVTIRTLAVVGILILSCGITELSAQNPRRQRKKTADPVELPPRTFRVDGGVKSGDVPDSLILDSLGRPLRMPVDKGTAGRTGTLVDSLATEDRVVVDSLASETIAPMPVPGDGYDNVNDDVSTDNATDTTGSPEEISRPLPDESDNESVSIIDGLDGTDAYSDYESVRDSLRLSVPPSRMYSRADSLRADDLGITMEELDLLRRLEMEDARALAAGVEPDEVFISRRERRDMARAERLADTTRINKIFRDTIPISKVTWISAFAPGFAQLYNSQAWKIPILYGTVGTSTYFWVKERKKYRELNSRYEYLMANGGMRVFASGATNDEALIAEADAIRGPMTRKNTAQQLWMVAAVGSYAYFIMDGAINYPGTPNHVKKATTLSTIIPGAGQVYNKSYWKVPIVLGGIATFAMVIDWNNRGYNRYKTAYEFALAQNPNGEYGNWFFSDPESAKNLKNSFRRNRDLCIILAAAFYALQIIDAHADAHMKTYDISDDLSMLRLEPMISNFTTISGGMKNTYGLSLSINF